jgi:hypothetical protein
VEFDHIGVLAPAKRGGMRGSPDAELVCTVPHFAYRGTGVEDAMDGAPLEFVEPDR